MHDGSSGENGRHILGVVISDAPSELIIADATERFRPRRARPRRVRAHVRIDRFHALRLAPVMEVRLVRRHHRRPRQPEVTVAAGDLSGRQIQFPRFAHMLREGNVLGFDALRIELQPQRHLHRRLLAVRMQVDVEVDLGAGLDQASRIARENIRILAHRILVQEETDRVVFGVLYQIGGAVVDHVVARIRLGLQGLNIDVLSEPRVDVDIIVFVTALGLQQVRPRHGDNHVRLADVPPVEIRKLPGARQVRGIAFRRALIHPSRNGRDLRVVERWIVLEFIDADVPVDVPRWHLPLDHLFLDRPRPGPGVLIGQQRHGSDRARAMAVLAFPLEDRRDVFVKGDSGIGGKAETGTGEQ